ncbi:MAG: glycine zipper 2TM domain-containing protein [Gammaproteobacteria bacterium]|nr:glycine zipper 2TM domain-containing protein [Gammaproteobacteria bacterium]
MNKHLIASLSAAAIALTTASHAGQRAESFTDNAQVIDVEPIVRTVRIEHPRRECWDEEVRHSAHSHHGHNPGGMIVGGVIGGLVGNSLGRRINKGRGRYAATAVGTLIGAAVGQSAGEHHHRESGGNGYREHCRAYVDYSTEERVQGYWVTYRYRGEEFRTRMAQQPGETLRVRVRVIPLTD